MKKKQAKKSGSKRENWGSENLNRMQKNANERTTETNGRKNLRAREKERKKKVEEEKKRSKSDFDEALNVSKDLHWQTK